MININPYFLEKVCACHSEIWNFHRSTPVEKREINDGRFALWHSFFNNIESYYGSFQCTESFNEALACAKDSYPDEIYEEIELIVNHLVEVSSK